MAKHWFGILPSAPQTGQRFDCFEPQRYGCIWVGDDCIEPRLQRLAEVPCFAHTVDMPVMGLVYCGITLIPPQSILQFMAAFDDAEAPGLLDFLLLLKAAHTQNKFVIHFGI